MKSMTVLKTGAVALACLGMLLPTPVLHAATGDAGSKQDADGRVQAVADVALDDGGTLRGQVVDPQGNPVAQTTVSLRRVDGQLVTTVADQSGEFQFTGLRGGTCRIAAGGTTRVYRLWAPRTAPPAARVAALVVVDEQQVLGQGGSILRCLRNPWIVAGIVAAAIAIPIAIHNARSKS